MNGISSPLKEAPGRFLTPSIKWEGYNEKTVVCEGAGSH